MTEWISIASKYPEFTQWYLCCFTTNYVRIIQTIFYEKEKKFHIPTDLTDMGFLLTHWSELPKYPGEK